MLIVSIVNSPEGLVSVAMFLICSEHSKSVANNVVVPESVKLNRGVCHSNLRITWSINFLDTDLPNVYNRVQTQCYIVWVIFA